MASFFVLIFSSKIGSRYMVHDGSLNSVDVLWHGAFLQIMRTLYCIFQVRLPREREAMVRSQVVQGGITLGIVVNGVLLPSITSGFFS